MHEGRHAGMHVYRQAGTTTGHTYVTPRSLVAVSTLAPVVRHTRAFMLTSGVAFRG